MKPRGRSEQELNPVGRLDFVIVERLHVAGRLFRRAFKSGSSQGSPCSATKGTARCSTSSVSRMWRDGSPCRRSRRDGAHHKDAADRRNVTDCTNRMAARRHPVEIATWASISPTVRAYAAGATARGALRRRACDPWLEPDFEGAPENGGQRRAIAQRLRIHLTDTISSCLDAALGFINTEQNDLFKYSPSPR